MHHVCDAESLWQNGKCERQSGWVKEEIEIELSSPDREVRSVHELEWRIIGMVAAKNRHFVRGGYRPYQMVFGENPRAPRELRSDGSINRVAVRSFAPRCSLRATGTGSSSRTSGCHVAPVDGVVGQPSVCRRDLGDSWQVGRPRPRGLAESGTRCLSSSALASGRPRSTSSGTPPAARPWAWI